MRRVHRRVCVCCGGPLPLFTFLLWVTVAVWCTCSTCLFVRLIRLGREMKAQLAEQSGSVGFGRVESNSVLPSGTKGNKGSR